MVRQFIIVTQKYVKVQLKSKNNNTKKVYKSSVPSRSAILSKNSQAESADPYLTKAT